jgi:hypothetical protein
MRGLGRPAQRCMPRRAICRGLAGRANDARKGSDLVRACLGGRFGIDSLGVLIRIDSSAGAG